MKRLLTAICFTVLVVLFTGSTFVGSAKSIEPSPNAIAIEGYHDGTDCNKIYGWAWDSAQPNTALSVDIFDGTTKIATVSANEYRSDLASKGNGFHAFNFATPAILKNGQNHSITVKYANTQFTLTNTPQSLFCTSTPSTPTNTSPGSTSSPGPVMGSTSVTLSWSASSGATTYGVGVRDMSTNVLVVDTNTSSTSYTANLSASKPYRWNVNACNSAGCSSFTTVLYFQTPGTINIPATPTNTSPGSTSSPGPVMGSTSVTLSWSASSGATTYGVGVRDMSTNLLVVDTNTSSTSYTANLSASKPYRWNVNACNSAGCSSFTTVLYFQTPAIISIPPTPTNTSPGSTSSPGPTTSSTSVTLSWSASSGATTYGVGVRDMSTNVLVVDTNTSSTSYTANLSASKPYRWNVNACNSAGCSSFTTVLYFQTPATANLPSAPQNFAAAGGNGQNGLAWNAPSSNGGATITSYRVFRGTNSTNRLIVTSGACANLGAVLGCTDTGLTNGQSYDYIVSAVNSVGQGPPSNSATATPTGSANLPGAPQNLAAAGGNGQNGLAWNAPSSNGGATITSYRVFRGTNSTNRLIVTSGGCANLGAVLGCTDTGLTNGQSYNYIVSAVNSAGQGPPSNSATATPVGGVSVPTISGYTWNTAPTDHQNFSGTITGTGFISGIRVFFCVNGSSTCYEHPQAGIILNNASSVSVSNVNLGTGSYQVSVQTSGGVSNRSSAFSVSNITAQPMLTASPTSGALGTSFRFTGSNFTRSSVATLNVTRPNGSGAGGGRYATDSNGNVSFTLTSQSSDPTGPWTFNLIDDGGKQASTSVQYSSTQPSGTDAVSFVADVTIPDNAQVTAGSDFVKTWRLKNVGTTTWSGYTAVFVSAPSNGNPSVNLSNGGANSTSVPSAAPNQTIDLSISMKTPSPGTYYSYWQLQNTGATRFGIQFYVKIRVVAKQSIALGFGTQSGRGGTNDSPPAKSARNADPVNTATGNYNYTSTDLRVPGRGIDVELARSYNSQDTTFGPLGTGWSHTFNIYLSNISVAAATLHYSDGKSLDYLNEPGTNNFKSSYPGIYDTLTQNADGTWTLKKTDQRKYQFDGSGKLTAIQDRNSNQISLTYDGHNLSQVTDTAGRPFSFSYSGSLLSSITDPVGRKLQFGYDSNSNLTSFLDANGNTNSYAYDSSNRLTKIVDGRANNLVVNSYGTNCPTGVDACVATQTNGRGNQWTFVYNGDGSTSVFDPVNKESKYLQDVNFNIEQTQDRNANTQFASGMLNLHYDESNNRDQLSDQKGNFTEFVYDQTGNVLSRTNPVLTSRQAVYDANNNPKQITDEAGKTTQLAYDAKGNLTVVTDALSNTSSTTYDTFGQPLNDTDSNGNTTTRTYDAQGNVTSIKDALGNVSNYSYDSVGRRVSVTDARGEITRYSYDNNDNVLTVTDGIGNVTTFTYDGNNNRVSMRDARGNTTTYAYNENNLLTKEIDSKGNFIQHTYDNLDRRISTRDKRGNLTNFNYDNEGRVVSLTDALGSMTSYSYDANGNRTTITDAKGQTTRFTYDPLNRLTKIEDALGNTIQKEYDPTGRLAKEIDPRGNVTQFTYDSVGNLTRVKDAAASTAEYIYDKNRNRISQTDPNNHTSNLAYDKLNRLISSTNALSHTSVYTYDELGNRVSQTDAKGQTTRYAYDADSRLAAISYPDNSSVQFTRDANGNVTRMVDSLGTSNYVYDELNRLTSYTDPFAKTIGYQYDENGNITRLTYPDGRQVTYQFDSNNRMVSLTDWAAKTTSFQYDSTNLLIKSTYPNGIVTSLSYDNAGRLTAKSDSGISSYSFILDQNGNRTSASISQPLGNRVQNTSKTYTYDAANRIQSAGATTFGFDNNGNMTSKTEAGAATNYAYDFENRLVSVSSSSQYSYDGEGVRLQKIENAKTTRYVVDTNHDLSQVLAETDAIGAVKAYYVYGMGLAYKVSPEGTHYYYHFDPIGSTVAMTDDQKNSVNKYAYDPFGRVTNSFENTSNPFQFVGQYGVMQDNSLVFVRARYYDPRLGRFLSRDLHPGNETDSQGFNSFAYTGSNPVARIDPSGLWWNPLPAIGAGLLDLAHGTSAAVNSLVLSGATLVKSPIDLVNFVSREKIPLVGGTLNIAKSIQKRAAYNVIGDNAHLLGIPISDKEKWELAEQLTKVTDTAAFLLQLPANLKAILSKGGDLSKAYHLIDTIKGTFDTARTILEWGEAYDPSLHIFGSGVEPARLPGGRKK